MKRERIEIAIENVVVKAPLREEFGHLSTLENSIRKLGLLYPVIIDRDNVLIAGARRLQACRNVGLETVAALRLDIPFTSMKALDVRSDENLCQEALTDAELEKLIRMKKTTMSGKTVDESPEMFSRIRKMLSKE